MNRFVLIGLGFGAVVIIAAITAGAVGCISEDAAITKAIAYAYPQGLRHVELPGLGTVDVVLGVERSADGMYVVHLCDLNENCPCRPGEGMWVGVSCNGAETYMVKQVLCPF